MTYADIILPLALPKRAYTYSVPDDMADAIRSGIRVEVQFGASKLYSGIVDLVHQNRPDYKVKPIIAVLDDIAVVSPQQLQLWDWMADYYCCTLGEVMTAALPGHLKLTSETSLIYNPAFGEDYSGLNDEEYLIAEALHIQQEITIHDARLILNKKTVFPVIQSLLHKGVLFLREDLHEKYTPRKIKAVRWAEPYFSNQELLKPVFDDLDKNEKQLEVVMALFQLSRNQPFISRKELLRKAGTSDSPLLTLAKKGIIELYDREVSRTADYNLELAGTSTLSSAQQTALQSIEEQFESGKKVVLLHGVTGSGKTQIYIDLIRKALQSDGQSLFLLPEIGLTTQMIGRLKRVFGNDIAVYHSKINYNERVEIWRGAASGRKVILGARSSLFLPFQKLQLIIVDEEHDPSFKQYDPAPRYNARDAAIYLAQIYGAKVLLGSATPGVETYHNTQMGKYGIVALDERFGGLQMPDIQVIDLKEQHRKKEMHTLFSKPLIDLLTTALSNGEQAILFQNRRGYAPMLECGTCGWNSMCKNCDVSLTYHKQSHRMRCHYCGFHAPIPETCPACGSGKLMMLGFGTEKVEDELKIFLPNARIARLDLDTAGTRTNLTAILNDFEEKEIDILVGTQMVTKGLDFENVAVVGVLGADQMVKRPDFRSGERAYQIMTQVAGRAGRKHKQGRVVVQAYNPAHPVIQNVLHGDYQAFIHRELEERKLFFYPPFSRLIHIAVLHKDEKTAANAAVFLTKLLSDKLTKNRVLGPVLPNIPRIRNYYAQHIMLKLERDSNLIHHAKQLLLQSAELTMGKPGWGAVRINIDVDPV